MNKENLYIYSTGQHEVLHNNKSINKEQYFMDYNGDNANIFSNINGEGTYIRFNNNDIGELFKKSKNSNAKSLEHQLKSLLNKKKK